MAISTLERLIKAVDDTVLNLVGTIQFNRFKFQNKSLQEIGICDGIITIIDKKINEINANCCVLTEDTRNKIINDFKKQLKKEHEHN